MSRFRGFKKFLLREVIQEIRKPVDVVSSQQYQEIGIRSHGKGIFYKEPVLGEKIGNKLVFWVQPECLIFNIVFAWEGAVSLTSSSELGMIASHRFPMYRCNSEIAIPDYLRLLFITPYGKNLLSLASPGGAGRNKTLGKERLLALTVYLPPVTEQRRIVEILASWDKAIAIARKLLEAKKKRKKALMKMLLSMAMNQSKIQEVKLKEIASIKTGPFGSLLHEGDYKDVGTPIITVEHLSENGILHQNLPLVSEEDKERLSTYILKEGDIVFSRVGSVDRSSVVSKKEDGWLFSGRLLRVRPKKKEAYYQFLNFYFHQESFKSKIRSLAVGGTMPCLNTQILGSIIVELPTIEHQKRIAEIIAVCNEEIERTQNLIDSYQQQKHGLMQKLLTGEWRVAVQKAA